MALKCPSCKSTDVTPYMGFQFGKYLCKQCGYIGNLIIEDNKIIVKRKVKRLNCKKKK